MFHLSGVISRQSDATGGGTRTDLAIAGAADSLFSVSARTDTTKVMVVVTDGDSNYPADTISAALDAR